MTAGTATMGARLAAVAAAAVAAAAAFASEVDGIAAQVGTETILKSDVYLEMRRLNAPDSSFEDVRNEMIDRKLVLRAAGEAKMTMQEWVVESRVRDIVKRAFGGDRSRLMDTLSKQRISYPEWRARVKEDMIVSAMRWNMVEKNVSPRPEDMRKEYEGNPSRYSSGAKVTVSVILLKPEDADKRDDVAKALATNDFASVARAFSADSRAADGGVWKDIDPKDVFKPEICDEIAKMPKGTLSRWVELDGWSFLLRKEAETPGRALSFEEAYDEIEANVRETEAKAVYKAWIGRMRSETYIKVY